MRLLYSLFTKSSYRGVSPLPHPLPARSLRSLAQDLTLSQMCPLRDFAPPKLKVFRRACIHMQAKTSNTVQLKALIENGTFVCAQRA